MTSKKSEQIIKQAIRFSKKIVVVMFASAFVFAAAMIATHYITGSIPDTLVTEFYKFLGIEGGALCAIKIAETIVDKVFEKIKEFQIINGEKPKENNYD